MDRADAPQAHPMRVERPSDREMVISRTCDASVSAVFAAWTTPALFRRWWVPKSMGVPLLLCEMDARTGGSYRLEFGQDASNVFAFFGTYLEVMPEKRLVWTNDEGPDGAVTTVTFAADGGKTLLTFHERYPTRQTLDDAMVGMESAMPEQFGQLDELLANRAAGAHQR